METPNAEANKTQSETPAVTVQATESPNVAAAPAAASATNTDALLQMLVQQNQNLQNQIDELKKGVETANAPAPKAEAPAPQVVRVRQYRNVNVLGENRKKEEIIQTYTLEDFERMSAKDENDKSQFDHLGMVVEVVED